MSLLSASIPYFTGKWHSRKWERILPALKEDITPSFAEIVADRVTSKFNKDVLFLLVGERGGGKSYALLDLAVGIGQEIAERLDGDRSLWTKYFTFDNVAVIQEDALVEKMQDLKPHNVYILDDAGVGWDSRDFATRTNKNLNHILMVCRTSNSVILISVPDPDQIDKVPRNMVRYYAEIAEQFHHLGMTMIKIFRNRRLFRDKKTLRTHIRGRGKVIRRWISYAPPAEILKEYDRVRAEHAKLVSLPNGGKEKEAVSTPSLLPEIQCMTCGAQWTPRKKDPKRCPRCGRPLKLAAASC